ncbi:FCD domain-containing protein [Stappia sp. F7233]|uniref:Pyruvate dehydrogenase complex repressor n=1 Tax=Stappia albiluteola TaxID=2758565 RepID=A0A839AKC8_9HYPH|nr:FCD domain-containing protein [Stappia albiluteola]MBA5779247.1 FCD domain-containing protein [Stappia albiluteola]
MVFQKISHNRTADAVVDQIEQLILQGVLRPGDRLPSERELAKKVDVSRPILREAIKVLEERKLIATRHGEGTFVADVIGTVFSDAVVQLIRRHPPAIADYMEFRREVESVAAGFAALRATQADREILVRIFAAMEKAHDKEDFAEEAELDVEFHQAIGESAHNIVLLHTLRSCYRLLADGVFYNRAQLYRYPGSREQLLAQHRAIFDAVMRGDREEAEAASIAHIDYVEKVIRDVERNGAWQEVSALRLQQRLSSSQDETKRRRAPRKATEDITAP